MELRGDVEQGCEVVAIRAQGVEKSLCACGFCGQGGWNVGCECVE